MRLRPLGKAASAISKDPHVIFPVNEIELNRFDTTNKTDSAEKN